MSRIMGQPDIQEPEIAESDLYYTDMSVGEILRRTRLHYRQSLQDIERALRIRASQIQAIEEGDTSQLPGRVYAIGFVRSYAEYLGLDGEKMVKLFKRQSGAPATRPALDFPATASETRLPPLWVIAVCTMSVILIISGWWAISAGKKADTIIPPVPVAETMGQGQSQITAEVPVEQAEGVAVADQADLTMPTQDVLESVEPPPVPDTMPSLPDAVKKALPKVAGQTLENQGQMPPQAAPDSQNIILNIRNNSWVEIRDERGDIIVSRVLKAGDQYYVPDRPDLTMSLGNAGAVQVLIDDFDLGFLGGKGEVLRNLPLDVRFLKEQYAPEQEAAKSNSVE